MKKRLIHRIARGLSFTTALFIFQACYGSPQSFGLDLRLEGTVTSADTGLPIENIKVSIDNDQFQYTTTDKDGKYSFYVAYSDSLKVCFQDIDSLTNRLYTPKNKTVTPKDRILSLDVDLIEK